MIICGLKLYEISLYIGNANSGCSASWANEEMSNTPAIVDTAKPNRIPASAV
jgi:hypothetical protein